MVLLIAVVLSISQVYAIPFRGEVFEQGTKKQTLLYRLVRTESMKDGEKYATGRYTDPSGKEVVFEEVFFKKEKLSRYVLHHWQTHEEGFMDVRGDQLLFSYTRNGKTRTNQETRPENLIIGPTTVDYLHANWKNVTGDELKVRFAVLDRLETIGFKFFKTKSQELEHKLVVYVTMEPSSFFVSLLVKPIHMIFDTDGTRLLEMSGRTVPKRKAGNDWHDLDADIVYHYN
jgi:hypothetical protein